jgi:hypothetical protein
MLKKVRVFKPVSRLEKEEVARVVQRKLGQKEKQGKLVVRLGRAS